MMNSAIEISLENQPANSDQFSLNLAAFFVAFWSIGSAFSILALGMDAVGWVACQALWSGAVAKVATKARPASWFLATLAALLAVGAAVMAFGLAFGLGAGLWPSLFVPSLSVAVLVLGFVHLDQRMALRARDACQAQVAG